MAEQVGGTPQKLHARVLHLLCSLVDHPLEEPGRLSSIGSRGSDVHVVEAEERCTQLLEELERSRHLALGVVHRIVLGVQPGTVQSAGPEDVETVPVEAVPVTDGEPQMLGHRAVTDDAVGVVPTEGERIIRFGSPVGDRLGDGGEELAHGWQP